MQTEKRKERIDRGIKIRSDGIYALSSWREITYLIAPRFLLIGGLLAAPLLLHFFPYWQKVLLIICIYALLSMAFDFLANYVGLVCLGGSFFVGVGGYGAALLNKYLLLSPLISIPLAALFGAAFCTLLLLPCLPLRGVYFAIITLMYPLMMTRIIEAFELFGGTNGMMDIQGFGNPWIEQYFLVVATLVFLFALRRLSVEDLGLVIRGIKDNDQSVRASGINITFIKAQAIFYASFLGCFAGAYLAHVYMWAGLSMFALDFSIIPIAATVVGGGGSLLGAVLGAILLVPLSEVLRAFGPLRIVVYSLILTVVIVIKGEGLLNYLSRKYHQFERWVEI
ncbi:MAG: branched-chain amino acid ABC transporter permease [Desulfobacca sp. 4484_104]|nr:MAG: branched-chain amino acid ABC transporter permease [Desulfobacca sp. 4484_104]RLB71867.1 MAG: branched-chain amino acid ABC transporter permease [Deltaproteobacteria bacterium]